jgi:16S rRNA G1207 methylase RsmC
MGSVGTEKIPPGFYDLIVSNIPAKIGDLAIEREFILKPLKLLKPNGQYWFVVVSGLNRLIPKIESRNNFNFKKVKKRKGYTVYRVVNPI